MIPQAKHLNFYDESIGTIHTIKFSGIELHRLIEKHPYRRINGGPVYEFDNRHDFDPAFFELDEEGYIDEDVSESDEV